MAFKGWEADDEYAEEHFIKVYFDFDTEQECRRFYNELFDDERFDALVNEIAGKAEERRRK